MGKGKGERENIPRVKALIITLNPAESKKISALRFTLLRAHFTPVAMERVCESACVCVNKHVLTDGKLKLASPCFLSCRPALLLITNMNN